MRTWISIKCVLLGGLLLGAPGLRGHAADWLNAGLLFDEFPLTLAAGHRTEALGPFYYAEQKDGLKTWGVPPLFSSVADPATDFREFDLLYPLFAYRYYGAEYRWHLFQVLSFSGGRDQGEQNIHRFTLFPIYFWQHHYPYGDEGTNAPAAAVSSRNYTALFPFYGHLQNRLYRDEIFFALFPFYSRTRKGTTVTDNYLWPIFHRRHGEGLYGWQFWPLLGHEHKDPTTSTNNFGDTELVGGHDHRFLLWPCYYNQTAGIGTENPQRQQGVLPFYSFLRSPKRDSTTVLWPFFTHITDRQKQYREWQLPWPLVIFARGEGKTVSRVWPFYSQAQNANLESDFYLWPFYKFNRVHGQSFDRERTRIMLFLFSNTRLVKWEAETGQVQQRVDFWPFFTQWRDFNGSTRLQIFAPLEPLVPNSRSVERNYSPLWSVWRAEHNTKTGAASQSLLWNLYRRETAPQSKKCSLLFGLFQYQSGSEGKRLRLFYIPVVRTRAPVKAD